MAVLATHASRMTVEMFIEAAKALADHVLSDLKQGLLIPLQSNILEAEIQTAARVARGITMSSAPFRAVREA